MTIRKNKASVRWCFVDPNLTFVRLASISTTRFRDCRSSTTVFSHGLRDSPSSDSGCSLDCQAISSLIRAIIEVHDMERGLSPRDSSIVPNSYEGLLPRRLSHATFSFGPTLSAFLQSRSIFFAGTCDGNLLRNFAGSCLRASKRAGTMADTAEPHAD